MGGGGASGAGRTASGLFFRILVVIVTTASLWVQLKNNTDNSHSQLAGKQAIMWLKLILSGYKISAFKLFSCFSV